MARRAGTRTSKKKNARGSGPDLEAIGLVLLALGLFVLVVLLPSLPSGELGAALRGAVLGRVGWGGYALPWPLLVLGGLFFVRRSPRGWPRVLAGYFVTALGAWTLLMLLQPAWAGAWGGELRALLTGAAGWLAVAPAVLLVLLGLELVLGWRPTRIARAGLTGGARAIGRLARAALAARARARERAAFHADVALARAALGELDKDLEALRALYPGSAELERWRSAVRASLKSLAQPTPEALADARMDIDAWREAVRDFARDRAAELAVHLKAEGIADFDAWAHGVKAQLDDPIVEPVRPARPLDDVRKTLALDLTALSERYRRLTRERDLAANGLAELRPRELARASEQHLARVAAYRTVQDDAAALEADADGLEPWRALMARLVRLAGEFPHDEELVDYAATLAKELRERGRVLLPQREGWAEALDAVELRARERALRAAAAEAEGEPEDETVEEEAAAGVEAGAPEDEAREDEGAAELEPFEPRPSRAGRFEDVPPWEEPPADLPEEAREEPEVGGIPIRVPGLELLDETRVDQDDPAEQAREVKERVRKIDETLANFRLEGRVVSSVRGPTVTRFEVEPAPGEKISRFANLSDDLALAMAVGSVRIEAPIPGKSVIGLEVPNAHRDLINFRLAVEAPTFRRSKARLPMILGKSIDGDMVVADLAKMPHLLIAGSTGSGKSVAVNTLIGSLVYKFLPTELRFLMIDPKMVELTPYDGIPHLLRPVVTNPNDAAGVLLGAVAHMERRYKMMSKIGAKNLDQYNEKARNLDLPEMPFIAIIIDELADLMITSPKEVESAIMRLAQMARATGMHLILATQRPSVDILTSLIKVNVPARMAFAVSSSHDSRTILDSMGAERLVGMGDMLFYQPGLVKAARLQGPYISEDEIARLADFLRRQYFDDEFVEAYGSDFDPPSLHDSDASGLIDWNDDKLREAAELVIGEGQASVSRLQRRLQVGHARAGKLMDSLEALGVVGPHQGSKPRDVIVEYDELPNLFGS